MNSIVLMGEIATKPEVRQTQEGSARASFLLRFPSHRANDPDYQVQVLLFGTAANEINGQYGVGAQVIVEGRLQMNSVTRPDGNREKRAELIARRVHALTMEPPTSTPVPLPAAVAAVPVPPRAVPSPAAVPAPPKAIPPRRTSPPPVEDDEIPF